MGHQQPSTLDRSGARAFADEEPLPLRGDLRLVVASAPMQRLVVLAGRAARVDSTVLIAGETGVGKERIARLIHDRSPRARGPFVAVNCGAIAETLLESELFGHTRGAFTGATRDRAGLFEAASSGTLFLDEVGDVSPGMQVKLLRVLQEREIRRVGENATRSVDVRVIAATNKNLAEDVRRGAFRADLYYRLKVIALLIPPLRDRAADILPLAHLALADAAARMPHALFGLSAAAASQLLLYAWPGNVRELTNAMESALALAEGPRIGLEDLPDDVLQDAAHLSPPEAVTELGAVRPLEAVEKDYILASLRVNGGNQARTAHQLEIGTATLYRKLKLYGLLHGA